MDSLLWTGEQKETAEDRRKVIAVLPNLIKSIADGLAYADIDDEVRVQLFAHLRKSHTAIFGRSAQPVVAAPSKELEIETAPVLEKEPEIEMAPEFETAPELEKEPEIETAPVIEKAPEKAATGFDFELPDFVGKSGASDKMPESEAAPSVAEPDKHEIENEAEASDTAGDLDFLSEEDKPEETSVSDEMRLDYLPSMNDADEIPELTDAVTAKAATPAEKPRTPAAPSATPDQKEVPEFNVSTSRAYEAPSAQLRAEMDKVMDATRTMFSDIDRFIMLGQYQNAISVLDSRIKHEPDDRGSWITLMAIYRDEDMKDDFYRTYAKFQKHFGEKPDA